MAETKSQKVLEANYYVCRSYRGKTARGIIFSVIFFSTRKRLQKTEEITIFYYFIWFLYHFKWSAVLFCYLYFTSTAFYVFCFQVVSLFCLASYFWWGFHGLYPKQLSARTRLSSFSPRNFVAYIIHPPRE